MVIKLGALGDFIQSFGPIKAIREHHKDAHITLLTTKPFEKLTKQSGYFDEIWIDKKPKALDIIGWISLRKKLNHAGFQRVYDLQNNDRTRLYFSLFTSKPEWSGADKRASHANTSRQRTAGHAFDGHVQTLSIAGITNIEIDPLNWMDGDISHLNINGPYALIVPGCAKGREEKRWPAEHYAIIAKKCAKKNITPVIIGTQDEEEEAKLIEDACQGKALNLINQTSLEQIVVLARNAQYAIGNDTGPMHLIAATGCPCLTIFSQHSDPIRHTPKGKTVDVIQHAPLSELSPEIVWAHIEDLKLKSQDIAQKQSRL